MAVAKQKLSQISLEVTWWAFTLVLAALVLAPIYVNLPDFPFFFPNFIYVVAAITLTRYLFFLHISWLRDKLILQGAISIAVIPLVFFMGQYFNYFITFFDENGPDILIKNLPDDIGKIMDTYMHAEYRFFGVWSIIAAVITPFRLLVNVWKRYRVGVR